MALFAKNDVSEWMTMHAAWCVRLFGLEAWEIYLSLSDDPGGHHAKIGQRVGAAKFETRYLNAKIELWEGLTEDQGKEAITHELGHILLGRIAQNHERLVKLLPSKLRKTAQALYSDAEEETLQRLTRAIHDTIKDEDMIVRDDDKPEVEPDTEPETQAEVKELTHVEKDEPND